MKKPYGCITTLLLFILCVCMYLTAFYYTVTIKITVRAPVWPMVVALFVSGMLYCYALYKLEWLPRWPLVKRFTSFADAGRLLVSVIYRGFLSVSCIGVMAFLFYAVVSGVYTELFGVYGPQESHRITLKNKQKRAKTKDGFAYSIVLDNGKLMNLVTSDLYHALNTGDTISFRPKCSVLLCFTSESEITVHKSKVEFSPAIL